MVLCELDVIKWGLICLVYAVPMISQSGHRALSERVCEGFLQYDDGMLLYRVRKWDICANVLTLE